MVRGPAVVVRAARLGEAAAIGQVLVDGLQDAPSAEYAPEEVPSRALDVGKELLGEVDLEADRLLLVAEAGGAMAALARVGPRDFVRSRHIADVLIVVHPAARGIGVGRALLLGVMDTARATGRLRKLVMRVADDDEALVRVVTIAGWGLERVERGALLREDGERDVHVYASWLGSLEI